MNNWWSKLSLSNKLKIPIQLILLVVMLLVQRVAQDKFEERVLEESRQKAIVAADGVLNGLNMLMLNGIINDADQRALYVKKMGASDKVLELRIIRHKPVQDQFGPGLPSEQAADEMDRLTLASAKEQSKLLDQNGVQALRVVVPFIAKKDFRGTDCLMCHAIPEGTVSGAASITMDISDQFEVMRKANMVLWGAQIAIQVFLYFVIGWLISFVTRPLRQAVELAGAVARGDLTQRIEVKSRDEIGQLLQALKGMNESLAGMIGEVKSAIDNITTGAGEISAGNSDLSQRTEEQAASLEETAASMEELTSTVKQNAENARQANQLAKGASEIASKGGAVVGQVVGTMSSINESSRKIVDIISVIDGIAFQTNILALNAAVEAARAGEQGRGFAVVAAEVRNLAQRSAAAAKEIKTLIGDSVGKVEDGTRLVDEAGKTMEEIVTAVKRVTDIMAEITAASAEQSSGIEQINQAVTQMDEVTQQNAALVEEAAAAAESLEEEAQHLMQSVSVFKLDEAARQPQARRAAAARPVARTTARPAADKHEAAAPARKLAPAHKALPKKDGEEEEWAEF